MPELSKCSLRDQLSCPAANSTAHALPKCWAGLTRLQCSAVPGAAYVPPSDERPPLAEVR